MSSPVMKDLYGRIMPSSKKQINDKVKELEKRINEVNHSLCDANIAIKKIFEELKTENDYCCRQIQDQVKNLEREINGAISHLAGDLSANEASLQKEIAALRAELISVRKEQLLQTKQTQKEITAIKTFVDQEFKRRDNWKGRTAETKRMSKGRPVWVIKCPAPDDASKIRWGDYSFALALKQELGKRGIYVLVDTREDWGCEAGADVVVVLRGCLSYRPDRRETNCLYIMWNISHPNMVTLEEYELYDVVCVASRHYAAELQKQIAVPVLPLLQCTDIELFYPSEKKPDTYKWDYIFIGNSRGVARSSVMWAIEDQLPLRMWGSGWDSILKDHMDLFEAPFIDNSKIPDLYRSARVTLNDHWDDMREKQFVNNRIFDALACGLPVITDTCEELRELFPDAVLHYETKEEFDECVRRVAEDYEAIRMKAQKQWPLIQKGYSFGVRAEQLIEIARRYGE